MYSESKFVASEDQKNFVLNFLMTHLGGSDPFPQDRVRNLYFDTWDLRSAAMAFSQAPLKKKFRLQLYDSTQQLSLQMKIKKNSLTEKRKIFLSSPEGADPFSFQSWDRLLELASDSQPQKNEFLFDSLQWGELKPLLHVEYTRRRYRIGECRITWDSDLVYQSSDHFPFAHRRAEPALGILEIKVGPGGLAPFLQQGLGLKLKQTNISKFKSGLLALRLLQPPFSRYTRNEHGFKALLHSHSSFQLVSGPQKQVLISNSHLRGALLAGLPVLRALLGKAGIESWRKILSSISQRSKPE